ncbi:hypothetical protein [Desulfosarcina variabilis]|uniref:hypothetical protein n=1 Tax=Desulfosarcina variabilis TaxID=2300 RepID=UPI003AFB2C94
MSQIRFGIDYYLTILLSLTALFSIDANLLYAKNILIIPPPYNYCNGNEYDGNLNQFSNNQLTKLKKCKVQSKKLINTVLSDIGLDVYNSMSAGINRYNRELSNVNNNEKYVLIGIGPRCLTKDDIFKFYNIINSDQYKLQQTLIQKKIDKLVWSIFEKKLQMKIENSLFREKKDKYVELNLYLYQNEKITEKTVLLKFKTDYMEFSGRSKNVLEETIYNFLKQNPSENINIEFTSDFIGQNENY